MPLAGTAAWADAEVDRYIANPAKALSYANARHEVLRMRAESVPCGPFSLPPIGTE